MLHKKLLKLAESTEKNLSLKNIHLWNTDCNRNLSVEARSKRVEVRISISVEVINSDIADVLPFSCRFLLLGVEKDTGNEVFKIGMTFRVTYSISPGYKPDTEEMEAFSRIDVPYDLWPYAREYVQNVLARMDIKPFTLPSVTRNKIARMSLLEQPLSAS